MSTTNVQFYAKCRLCLDNAGKCNIFSTKHLVEDILSCTGVQVNPNDKLPQNICGSCLDVIENAKQLRKTAQSNNELLQSLFDCDSSAEDDKVKQKISPSSSTASIKKSKIRSSEKRTHKKRTLSSDDDSPERSQLFKLATEATMKHRDKSEKSPKRDSLRSRIKFVNDDEDFKFACDICPKKFPSHKKLYMHQRQHNKTVVCPLDACGMKFATKNDLNKHVRTHTGEKPFVCDICDKKFAQQGTLKAHKENVHYCFTHT